MSNISRPTIWPAFKAEIDADCKDQYGNNDVTFWSQARLHIILLTQNRLRGDTASMNNDFHQCWYRFIATSQNIEPDHPAQDRLVMQIMFARSLCNLSQTSETSTHATTGDNPSSQAEPPFIVEDLAATWQHDLSIMSVAQRTSFAGFVARLVATGVGADHLGDLTTTYVRETLEHTGLTILIAPEGNGRHLDHDTVQTLQQRLPATRALLQYCGHRIVAGRKDIEEIRRWTALLYTIGACFAEMGPEYEYLKEQARLAGNWLGTFGQMIGIDRVRY